MERRTKKTRKYFADVQCDGPGIFPKSKDGVYGAAFIHARSRDAATKQMISMFFERFPRALENRVSVIASAELA